MGDFDEKDVVTLCGQIGRVLLENGAETSRVEGTVEYIGRTVNIPIVCHATMTAVFVNSEKSATTRIFKVRVGDFNLQKVDKINTLSRQFSNHELNTISRSSLITRTTNDVNQLQNVLGMIFTTLLFAPLLGIGSIIKAFELGTNLSWIILVTFIAVTLLLIIITLRVLPYFKITQEIIDKINRITREVLIGIPVIKAFVRQDYETEKFRATNQEFYDVNIFVFRTMLIMMPLMTLIMNMILRLCQSYRM